LYSIDNIWLPSSSSEKKTNDKPDPYVRVEYKEQTDKTEVFKRTIAPKYQRSFEFTIPDKKSLGEVVIDVWDEQGKKNDSSHVFMGEVRLNVPEFCGIHFDYAEQHTYELKGRGKNKVDVVGGDIDLKIGMKLPEKKRKKPSRMNASGRSNKEEDATLEEILEEADEVVDDTLASVNRSLQVATNTRRIGQDTIQKLDEQGEQIKRAIDNVADIEDLQDREDRHIRVIENPLGGIGNVFHRKKKKRRLKKMKK